MNTHEVVVTSPYSGLFIHIKSFPVSSTDYLDRKNAAVALAGEFMKVSGGKLTRPVAADLPAGKYVAWDTASPPAAVQATSISNSVINFRPYLITRDAVSFNTDVVYSKRLETLVGPTPIRVKLAVYEHSGNPAYAVGDSLTLKILTDPDGKGDDTTPFVVGLAKYDVTKGGGHIIGTVVAVPDSDHMMEVELIQPRPGPATIW